MKCRSNLIFPALLALATLGLIRPALAGPSPNVTVLTNLPFFGAYTSGPTLTASDWVAVGLTTSTSAENFVSMDVRLATTSAATGEGGIYSDVSGHPGALLSANAAFNNVSVPAASESVFLFTTLGPVVLQPSTSYWFVLHDAIPFNWEPSTANSNTGLVPTPNAGYTFLGFKKTANSGGTWAAESTNPGLDIVVSVAAPEPATLSLIALAALPLLTRRRRVSPPSAVHFQ